MPQSERHLERANVFVPVWPDAAPTLRYGPWTTLGELRPLALFEFNEQRYVKSTTRGKRTGPWCMDLADNQRWPHADDLEGGLGQLPDDIPVREILLPPPQVPVELVCDPKSGALFCFSSSYHRTLRG